GVSDLRGIAKDLPKLPGKTAKVLLVTRRVGALTSDVMYENALDLPWVFAGQFGISLGIVLGGIADENVVALREVFDQGRYLADLVLRLIIQQFHEPLEPRAAPFYLAQIHGAFGKPGAGEKLGVG